MSECPLENLDPGELAALTDPEGWIWEPRIPNECYQCLNAVPEAGKAWLAHEVINEETGLDFDDLQDRYFVRGLQLIDSYGGRLAIEETGIDQGSGYDGPKTNEILFTFDCEC